MAVLLLQYLALARECIGYGEVTFPHCGCDARKEGHVIPSLGFNSFRLQACKDDGTVQVILFTSLFTQCRMIVCSNLLRFLFQ